MQQVLAAVPKGRCLVYSVTEGWEPLCAFLGVPVPDTPFPRINDRAQLQARLRKNHIAVRILPVVAVTAVCVGLAVGLLQYVQA
jgi:Sulfotransferase domain